MSSLTIENEAWILDKSIELGFLECKAIPLIDDPNYEAYEEWVIKGHHEPLKYLNKNLDKRKNPANLGKSLKTAIVFLHPYPKSFSSEYIAKYALGKDYHYFIKEKLKNLSSLFQHEIKTLVEEKFCVDSVPILERSLAQRSGLGWVGKNGCLISRKHGSFFLISVWLISLEIENYTEPQPFFHCGKCTRCIDACPTDAFLTPGFLDTHKCLSTQTIENRKQIPFEFYKKIDTYAFGCDICQDVCPWNRKHNNFINDDKLPDVITLLKLTEPEFRAYFKDTALMRPGWAGLKRNLLIFAANTTHAPKELFLNYKEHDNTLIRETSIQILKEYFDIH